MADRADPLTRTSGRGRSGIRLGAAVAALAVLELAWLGWFLAEPLPNAGNVGGQAIRRSMFLWQALPGVVPGLRWRESMLGAAVRELSHVENLPQRLPIVAAAGLIGGAAVALGLLLLRGLGLHRALRWAERLPLSFGLGAVGLGLATLVLGRLGWLAPGPTRVGLGLVMVPAAAFGLRDVVQGRGGGGTPRGPVPWAALAGFVLVAGPFLVVMALGAMLPTIDYDALEYHLQGPKEYYLAGRIAFLPHNVYTSMPFGVEMLHLLGMTVLDDWWRGALVGQLLVAAFAPASAAMVALTTRRWASPRAAWIAAVVYLTAPWIYRLAVIPYVEGPLCYFHAALIWAAARAWDGPPDLAPPSSAAIGPLSSALGHRASAICHPSWLLPRLWLVIGLLAGGAMACKYPGLVSAVVPFGVLAMVAAVRARSWRVAAAFGVGVAVAIGPWLVKNVVDTGNPVYPLAYGIFGGRHWSLAQDAKWAAAHGGAFQGRQPLTMEAFTASLIDVAGRSDWQSPLFAALAPLALLRPGSRRAARVLWGYVAYLFLTWWLLTHRLDRFWLPLLPPAAVLAGLGADWARGRAWTALLTFILAVGIASNLVYCTTALAGFNEWTGDLNALRHSVPRMLNAPLARLDAELPADARPLLIGQASVFHLGHRIVYNTVFNEEIFETLARDRTPEQVRDALSRRGITHVYVDWHEIERFRRPGNYGFTAWVTPERFARLVRAGVLEPLPPPGPGRDLYAVRTGG